MRSLDPIKDYYQALGIDRHANFEQIRRAYHARARTSHPDLGGSPDAMRDLNEAYEVLSDQATRNAYDRVVGIAVLDRPPEPKMEAPVWTESAGIPRPDRDLLWLTTRAILCALLGVFWLLIVEEASPHRGMSVVLSWLMRGLGIVTIGVGILFGYSAHRLAEQKMRHINLPRPERRLWVFKSLFRAVIAGFLGFVILSMYLSK